jgi:hypothetical protein
VAITSFKPRGPRSRGQIAPPVEPAVPTPENSPTTQIQKARAREALLLDKETVPELRDTHRYERFVVGTQPARGSERINRANPQKPSEAQQANEMLAVGKVPRRELQDKLIALAASGGTEKAQQDFANFVEKYATTAEDKYAIVNKVRELWRAAPQTDLSILEQSFRRERFQLRPGTTPVSAYQLDRKEFGTRLAEIVSQNHGQGVVLNRNAALDLLSRLDSVIDKGDLFWAHWKIARLVEQGKVKLADSAVADLFAGFFRKKLNLVSNAFGTEGVGRVDMSEIAYAVVVARKAGFSGKSFDQLIDLVNRIKGDTDALFYARRVFDRVIVKAERAAATPAEKARLVQAAQRFHTAVDPRLSGHFDRYAVKQNLNRLEREGKLSPGAYLALTAAAVTSRNREEFAHGIRCAEVTTDLNQFKSAMHEVWEGERKKREEQREREKTEDEHSVIAVTENEQIQRTCDLDDRLSRTTASQEREALAIDCYLLACESQALSGLVTARTAEEADTLESRIQQSKQDRAQIVRPR